MQNNTLAYGLVFDNLLGLSAKETRRLINMYAILYPGLIASDSWFLTNSGLQQTLSEPDGHLLIREGIVVMARRTSAPTLTDFLGQAMAKKMHGVVATEDFTQRIDAIAAPILSFDLSLVGPAYQAMAAQVLKPDFLVSLGMSQDGVDKAVHEYARGREQGIDVGTNTFVKDVVCPQLALNDAELLMEAVRAPYSLNLPNVLGTGIVGPKGFRGDRILAALRGQTVPVGSIEISDHGDWSGSITDPMASWLINEVLGTLSAEELVAARSTSRRTSYLDALSTFMAAPVATNWTALASRFDEYVREAGAEVFRLRTTKSDPRVGQIDLIGEAGALRIVPSNETDPVRLNPLQGGEDNVVRVVGRTIQRPVMSANPISGTAA